MEGREALPLQDAEQAADEVLASSWWLTGEPDEWQLPVDPFAIADALGVDVYLTSMKPDVSGAIRRMANGRPTIYLNSADAPVRQRFTCAHELGHYKQRIDRGSADFEFVDFRGTLASTGTDFDERYANGFAAALLMPRALVKSLRWQTVAEAAATFNVSTQAMGLRRQNLGVA